MKLIDTMPKALSRTLALFGCLGIAFVLMGVPEAGSQPSSSGTLFGVAFVPAANEFELFAVDPVTGGQTLVGSLPGANSILQGVSALDAASHRNFLVGFDNTFQTRLFVVDTQSGAVIADPLISQTFASLDFDPATGTLFGVAFIHGANEFELFAVDPATGGQTLVGSLPGASSILQGVSALDAASHRNFLVGFDNTFQTRLFVVDTQTGAVIADPLISQTFASLDFDPATGTLFGVAFIPGANEFELFAVDPATGGQTLVGSLPGASSILQGVSALDAASHRNFLVGFDNTFQTRLFVVDTQTGAVIADPPLATTPSSLEFEPVLVKQVANDIKPGSDPNSINPKSKGKIPVAILTTATFDATTVDPTTVRFGKTGTEAAPVHSAMEDVDRDGDTDMILHFKTQDTGIVCGDTSASLTGETFDGQMIEGSDSVNTVGCE